MPLYIATTTQGFHSMASKVVAKRNICARHAPSTAPFASKRPPLAPYAKHASGKGWGGVWWGTLDPSQYWQGSGSRHPRAIAPLDMVLHGPGTYYLRYVLSTKRNSKVRKHMWHKYTGLTGACVVGGRVFAQGFQHTINKLGLPL